MLIEKRLYQKGTGNALFHPQHLRRRRFPGRRWAGSRDACWRRNQYWDCNRQHLQQTVQSAAEGRAESGTGVAGDVFGSEVSFLNNLMIYCFLSLLWRESWFHMWC